MRMFRAVLGACALALSAACPVEEPQAPEAPTVDVFASPTAELSQTVTGTRPASTAVRANGKEIAPLDGTTTWQGVLLLQEGDNQVSFTAMDARGRESEPVVITIVVDRTAPAPPTIEDVASPTTLASIELRGIRESGSEVRVNGEVVAEAAIDPAWSATVDLAFGDNEIRATATDELGNESAATVIVVRREEPVVVFTVDPVPEVVADATLTLSGTRSADVAVEIDGVEVLAPCADCDPVGAWEHTVTLQSGENDLVVSGVHPAGTVDVVLSVLLDDVAPAPPAIDAPPALATEPTITLTGTKEPGTCIMVNGVVVVPVDQLTTWQADVSLVTGENVLQIAACDAAGNVSAPITPEPNVYYDPTGIFFTVDAVPAQVCGATLTLTGRRGTDVEVWIDGVLRLANDGAQTTWSTDVTLSDGDNSILVEGRLANGAATQRTVTTFYGSQPPNAPVVNAPAVSAQSPLTVSGTKPATAFVRRDGTTVANPGSSTFTDTLPLAQGVNTFEYVSLDACGRTSAVTEVSVTFDDTPAAATFTEPQAGDVVGASVLVSGTATDDLEVESVSVCIGPCTQSADYVPATLSGSGQTVQWSLQYSTGGLARALDGSEVPVRVRVRNTAGITSDAQGPSVLLMRRPRALNGLAGFNAAANGVDVAIGPGGELYTVFDTRPTGGDQDVYLVIQQPTGYVPQLIEVSDLAGFIDSRAPRVAVDDLGVVHMTWLDTGSQFTADQFRPGLVYRSFDPSLPSDQRLSAPLVVARGEVGLILATDFSVGADGSMGAVWWRITDTSIFVGQVETSIFDDASGAWGAAQIAAAHGVGASQNPQTPRIAMGSGGLAHVVWTDEGNIDGNGSFDYDVVYRRFQSASGFTAPIVVSANDGIGFVDGDSTNPTVAVLPSGGNNRVYVGWIDNGDVRLRALDDGIYTDVGGAPLGPIEPALHVSAVAGHVSASVVDVAVDDLGVAHVVWHDSGSILSSGTDGDVFLRRYDGAALSSTAAISDRFGNVASPLTNNVASNKGTGVPAVAADALGNTHVAFAEEANLDGTISGAFLESDVLWMAVGALQ